MGKRPSIAMSPEQVEAFLSHSREMVVGCYTSHGWPVGSLVSVDYDTGTIAVTLTPEDPLEDCVVAGAAVCCLAEESPSYYEIKGAIARGTITSVKDGTGGSHLVGVRLGPVLSFDFSRLPEAR